MKNEKRLNGQNCWFMITKLFIINNMVAGKYKINNFKNLKEILICDYKFSKKPKGYAFR